MSGWGYDVTPSHQSKHKRFIEVYDPTVDTNVWFEWNRSEKSPRIHRWNPETNMMWWTEWDLDVKGCRQADEIPSIQGANFSCTANFRPLSPSEWPKRKKKKK
jgi:hypothetical protein